jgi:hypothetical protein
MSANTEADKETVRKIRAHIAKRPVPLMVDKDSEVKVKKARKQIKKLN